jgi:1-deoxy-D-xylulose-5-phosphate reductoisomerase
VRTDPVQLGQLTFEPPDPERFPALKLARRAGEIGGTLPAVFNAANEAAVEAFIARRITFPQISEWVARVMSRHAVVEHPDLARILEADRWARIETAPDS